MPPLEPASNELQEIESGARLQAAFEHVRAARDAQQLPLTPREREVLELVAGGLRGAEIAQQLVLSPETIKSHVQNAMTKLGANTRAHAVAIALRAGQVDTLTVSTQQVESEARATPTPPLGLSARPVQ
jgi:DNA-binding CsgD family transcriptional regulator